MHFIIIRRREPLRDDKWIVKHALDSYDEATDLYNSYIRKGVDYYDIKLVGE